MKVLFDIKNWFDKTKLSTQVELSIDDEEMCLWYNNERDSYIFRYLSDATVYNIEYFNNIDHLSKYKDEPIVFFTMLLGEEINDFPDSNLKDIIKQKQREIKLNRLKIK